MNSLGDYGIFGRTASKVSWVSVTLGFSFTRTHQNYRFNAAHVHNLSSTYRCTRNLAYHTLPNTVSSSYATNSAVVQVFTSTRTGYSGYPDLHVAGHKGTDGRRLLTALWDLEPSIGISDCVTSTSGTRGCEDGRVGKSTFPTNQFSVRRLARDLLPGSPQWGTTIHRNPKRHLHLFYP